MRTFLTSQAICWCFLLSSYGTNVFAASSLETGSAKDEVLMIPVGDPVRYQMQNLEPLFDTALETRRVKVSYPLIAVPPMTIDDGMITFGELSTYLPCHDCLVLSMEADVTYQNGTRATPASMFWLHHAVFVNRGKVDHFCGPKSWGQRFFAVGNERTAIDMSSSGTRVGGYHIEKSDEVALSVDLMNMSLEPQDVIFTVTYEFVENIPHDFTSIEPVWLDIGGCESSSAPAQPDSAFDFTSPVWSSSLSGEITFIGAHLHDGGTHLQVLKNEEIICDAQPKYTNYASQSHSQSEKHIDTISTCPGVGQIALNDELKVKAFYNTSLHKPMLTMNGTLEPVMGISLLYIGIDYNRGTVKKEYERYDWSRRHNFILSAFCLILAALLVGAWHWQNRDSRRTQWLQGIAEQQKGAERDLKIPLLPHNLS